MIDESALSNPFDLSNYQSAAVATVNPNPTIPNSNSSGVLNDFTQLAGVAAQWGTTFANIFGGQQRTVAPTGVGIAQAPANPTMTLLLLGGAILVVVLVIRR